METQSLRTDDCAEEIIETYADMVYRIAVTRVGSSADAEDIFQEVFLRYSRYACRHAFESEEHRRAWLIRVTLNCSKTFWSSAWRSKTVPLEEENCGVQLATEEQNELFESLQALPEKYRTVLHLFYFEDLTTEEIGKVLRLRPSVRMRLSRGREQLREAMKGGCCNEPQSNG